jgi:hypothetical protein
MLYFKMEKATFLFIRSFFACIICGLRTGYKPAEIIITKANLVEAGVSVPVLFVGEPVDSKSWPVNFKVLLAAARAQRSIH